ncbi:hypothetical protein N7508_008270 [Penicillium antarcticum]|uniref:uncharacterized protein n=1 Tax=Penicillium antarcticum TaxID=416450 RepID=UPI00238EDD3D|nr:uncharacterized protein N7508_008270 [Penicillium antarcticum]KAJ5298021.1 hypothetical protein N7508_008270 [Penicillium antarcticum]
MTWKVNFTAWWRYWAGGLGATRDFKRLDEILPSRIKDLEDWMKKTQYDGSPRSVLKIWFYKEPQEGWALGIYFPVDC